MRAWVVLLLAAACLIGAGLSLTAATGLETVWWLIFAAITAVTFTSRWRRMRRHP